MKKFNTFCSIFVIFTLSIFIITLGQNLIVRSQEPYLFYFNDSRAVDHIYTDLSNSEMAEAITDFMNSWRPDEFQVYEDTGYDLEGLFSEDDSYNMLRIKKIADMSLIICIISCILSVGMLVQLLKNDCTKLLRKGYAFVVTLSLAIMIGEVIMMSTNEGMMWAMNFLKLKALSEDSSLCIIMGSDFVSMMGVFLLLITLAILGVITYIVLRLTKPPRIFY